jgi:SAM-dependent methyltransferase
MSHLKSMRTSLKNEQRQGLRDKFFIPMTYTANLNNTHWSDIGYADEYQLEVYILARDVMRRNKLDGLVVDVGCGSGYKLVHYLATEFTTVGIETEPAISYLRETYPDNIWFDSGEQSESGPNQIQLPGECSVMISSDVIEHIR